MGSDVARAEKNEATELEDMAGVKEIDDVGDGEDVCWRELVLEIDVDAEVEVTKEFCARILPGKKQKMKTKKY